ncbi:esterase-like activity of phytase family protein [Streptomyces sp. HNM0574]|uniref:esterase-like activity of phytase family protein n=1 Tax=Streptomyces sp. HNM0574 TaxID=2714954 RepID=UPI00146B3583|nr:esterase-like activity of phytase family protein [Streptomyces sp. HNM0574]NLU69537.1 esterase-like activity of phytase family protein [Streptomyces sp. HNM0574]
MGIRSAVVVVATSVALTCGTASAAPPGAGAEERAGGVCSPQVRLRGYSDALDKTEFGGRPVAGLSALAAGPDGRVDALSDRSALFTLGARDHRPERVVPLADEAGRPLDSEGLVQERDGSLLVSSETEPSVRHYAPDGRLLGRLPVPDELRVAPEGRARENQTLEGLTLSPDGRTLTAAMEGPLDGERPDAHGHRVVRFQTWERDGRGAGEFRLGRQYRYAVDDTLFVPEITALADGRLLVLERGYDERTGSTVRLHLADPRRAASDGAPAPKRLLADLGDCGTSGADGHAAEGSPLVDNIEGMAVTRGARGGPLRLLLVSDDNESDSQVTRLYRLDVRL